MEASGAWSRLRGALAAPGIFRLFLALVVVLQHFTTFNFGRWAVFVFFMLSGYWISVMYLKKYRYTRAPYVTYLCSRFWRLFPVYAVTTFLGGLILKASSRHWSEFSPFVHNPWWLAREFLIVSSSDQPALMNPTWSLDIEMQFYIAAPLLILWASRAGVRRAFWTLAGCACACVAFWRGADLPKYLPLFLAGLLIHRCDWRPGGRVAAASLGLVAAVVAVVFAMPSTRHMLIYDSSLSPLPNYYLCLALAMLTAPYVAYTVRQPASKLDGHYGNLAYSVYLGHGCVYVFCIYFAGFHDRLRNVIGHSGWILVPMAALALYALVDRPSERLRKRFIARRLQPIPPQAAVAGGMIAGAHEQSR